MFHLIPFFNFNIFWILIPTSVLFEHNSAVLSQIMFRISTEAPPSHKLIRITHTSWGRLCCLPITSCSSTPTKQCQLTNSCPFEGRYCFVAFIVSQKLFWKLLNTKVCLKSASSPNIITSVFQRVMRRRTRPRQVICECFHQTLFLRSIYLYDNETGNRGSNQNNWKFFWSLKLIMKHTFYNL